MESCLYHLNFFKKLPTYLIDGRTKTESTLSNLSLTKGLFRLAANLVQPATVTVRCSENRKMSNYLQQPSRLQQLLQPATGVNEA